MVKLKKSGEMARTFRGDLASYHEAGPERVQSAAPQGAVVKELFRRVVAWYLLYCFPV